MSSKSYSLTQAVEKATDARMAIEGATQQVIGPEATVGQAAGVGISVGEFGQFSQAWENVSLGVSGETVRDILLQQGEQARQTQAQVSHLASSAVSALSQARTGEPTQIDYSKYIPYAIVGVIVLAMIRRGHK